MKLILTISAMILFLITGCESGKQPANDFLTVDITANYPKKELISSRLFGCGIHPIRNE